MDKPVVIVFSRERDEEFVIRDESGVLATVQIVDIRGAKVRVGVMTRRADVQVHRLEVWEAIQRATESRHSDDGSAPDSAAE